MFFLGKEKEPVVVKYMGGFHVWDSLILICGSYEAAAALEAGAGMRKILTLTLAIFLFLAPYPLGLMETRAQYLATVLSSLLFAATWLWATAGRGQTPRTAPARIADGAAILLTLLYAAAVAWAWNRSAALQEAMKCLLYLQVYWMASRLVTGREELETLWKGIYWSGLVTAILGLLNLGGVLPFRGWVQIERLFGPFLYPNATAAFLGAATLAGLYFWHRAEQERRAAPNLLPAMYLLLTALMATNSLGLLVVYVPVTLAYLVALGRLVPPGQAPGKSLPGKVAVLFLLALWSGPRLAEATVRGGERGALGLTVVLAAALWGWGYLYRRSPWSLRQVSLNPRAAWRAVLVAAVLLAGYLAWRTPGSLLAPGQKLADTLATVRDSLTVAVSPAPALQQDPGIRAQKIQQLSGDRLFFYRDALRIIRLRPWLGGGGGAWVAQYTRFQSYFYTTQLVHSHYLQVALETGLLGLLVLLGLIAASLAQVIRQRVAGETAGPTLLAILALLALHAAIDFDLSYPALGALFWTMLGVSAAWRGGSTLPRSGSGTGTPEQAAAHPVMVALRLAVLAVTFLLAATAASFVLAGSYWLAAQEAFRRGGVEEALALGQKAVRCNPWEQQYLASLAHYVQIQGHSGDQQARREAYRRAETLAGRALALDPNNSEVHYFRGLIRSSLEKHDDATADMTEAVQGDPFNTRYYEGLAQINYKATLQLLAAGKREEAASHLAALLRIPGSLARQRERLDPLSARLWREALPLVETAPIQMATGAAYYLTGKTVEAEAHLLQAVNPSAPEGAKGDAYLWLAVLYEKQGKKDVSREALEMARHFNPAAAGLVSVLGQLPVIALTNDL